MPDANKTLEKRTKYMVHILEILKESMNHQKGINTKYVYVKGKRHWNILLNELVGYSNVDDNWIVNMTIWLKKYDFKDINPIVEKNKIINDNDLNWIDMNLFNDLLNRMKTVVKYAEMKKAGIREKEIQDLLLEDWTVYVYDDYDDQHAEDNYELINYLYPLLKKSDDKKATINKFHKSKNTNHYRFIKQYLAENGIKPLLSKMNKTIIETKDKDLLTVIGSETWCFKNSETSYIKYVADAKKQFLIYNFIVGERNKQYVIGITIGQDNEILHAFNNHNQELTKEERDYYFKMIKKHL